MNHIVFTKQDKYDVALLIKQAAFDKNNIANNYKDLDLNNVICFSLYYDEKNSISKSKAQTNIDNIIKLIKFYNIKVLFINDSKYFKYFTKLQKVEPHFGSIVDIPNVDCKAIVGVNYQSLIFNPKLQDKLNLSIKTLNKFIAGEDTSIGSDIIHYEHYPDTDQEVSRSLQELLKHETLTVDIETTGLSLKDSRIVSIAFAWSMHEGISFAIDESNSKLIKEFFTTYTGKTIWHKCTFDITHIIWHYFMDNPLDYSGMINGLHVMFRDIEDTMIVTYLATNSTEGNDLSLKNLALEYAGNWALLEEEHDSSKYPIKDLLKYNLVDTLCTWYTYDKYLPIMIEDEQEDIYRNIMLPSLKVIVQMQLVGMPMDYTKVKELSTKMYKEQNSIERAINSNPIIKEYNWRLQKEAFIAKNATLKRKFIPLNEFKTEINLNSNPQLQGLLYGYLNLPILDTTKGGSPATGKDTLSKLLDRICVEYGIDKNSL